MSVLFPQPDGPISAVMRSLKMSKEMSRTAGLPLYATWTSLSSKTGSVAGSSTGTWPAIAGATSTVGRVSASVCWSGCWVTDDFHLGVTYHFCS